MISVTERRIFWESLFSCWTKRPIERSNLGILQRRKTTTIQMRMEAKLISFFTEARDLLCDNLEEMRLLTRTLEVDSTKWNIFKIWSHILNICIAILFSVLIFASANILLANPIHSTLSVSNSSPFSAHELFYDIIANLIFIIFL